MAKQILVALKGRDRLSHMIPYIEKIAQPGMQVVFLMRSCPQSTFMSALNDREEALFAGCVEEAKSTREPKDSSFMDEQRLIAEHKVFLAQEALLKRGIEVTVDVYTGSLRRVLKSYVRTGNVNMIVTGAGMVLTALQFLSRTLPRFLPLARSGFPPVRLFCTDNAAS
ncbi:MAG TPA: hypothetical protein VFU31_19120 [Candidatus Binatia bacterium]|nr:hypothetical protein [Candidatus Binatia bacterium]